jgi:hypothetical protein
VVRVKRRRRRKMERRKRGTGVDIFEVVVFGIIWGEASLSFCG